MRPALAEQLRVQSMKNKTQELPQEEFAVLMEGGGSQVLLFYWFSGRNDLSEVGSS